ncbi:MAG TPA: DsbC family protein [Steroidobacteraceae bacterium]|nr:DsbC family protein [Steroidobacteraceae bacterium]
MLHCSPENFSSRLRGALVPLALLACTFAAARAAQAAAGAAPAPPPAVPESQPRPAIAPQYAELAKKLAKALPEYTIQAISPSGVQGVLEVQMDGNRIIYSDSSGKHLFNGHLFDLDTHEDLTERRIESLTRIDVKQLPLSDAFDVVRGNGRRQLYLFEDPDCPYCKKLEEELPKVNDVTLHVFLYPLTSIHPHAYEHALGVWCSSDRQKAWSDKMLKGIDPPAAKCANPVDRNLALGEKLKIDGTPTIVFADGRVRAGLVSADELEHLLAGGG